jgi:hypothetical protein
VLEDVTYVVGLEAVIYSDIDSSSGGDAEDGFEEGRSVGAEDADALVLVFSKVVSETSCAVSGFEVGAAEDFGVRCYVVYCRGLEEHG